MFMDFKLWNSRILGAKVYYQAYFKISLNTPEKCMDATLDMHLLDKIYTYQKYAPIPVNKQSAYTVAILRDDIPSHLKHLSTFNFSKHLKLNLFSEQHSEN